MEQSDALVIEAVLNRLFKESYFSICSIDKILKLAGIPRGGKNYDRLNALHCVHYAEMSPELREHLVVMVRELLSSLPFEPNFQFERARPVSPPYIDAGHNSSPPRGFLQRWLS